MKSTYKEEYRRLLDELIAARKKALFTQQELAQLLGKPQSFVSKYEKGERRLDVVEFVEITKAIGADYKMIIRRAYDKSNKKFPPYTVQRNK